MSAVPLWRFFCGGAFVMRIVTVFLRNTVGENQEIHLVGRPPEKVANPRGARLWAIVTTFVKEIYFSG